MKTDTSKIKLDRTLATISLCIKDGDLESAAKLLRQVRHDISQ